MDSTVKERSGWMFRAVLGMGFLGASFVLYKFVGPHLGWMVKKGGQVAETEEGDAGKNPAASAAQRTFERLSHTYVEAWHSVQKKMDDLKRLELENVHLKLENAQLKQKVAVQAFDRQKNGGAIRTDDAKRTLASTTGSSSGRTIDQITYQPPAQLSNSQLLTMATSYFKAREDEKAAVILHRLIESDDQTMRAPRIMLMAGVAWYRLDNFKLADEFFGKVIQSEVRDDAIRYHAQARLWRGLVALKLEKPTKAQFWFRELIDNHPHSMEAKWVNTNQPALADETHNEVNRVPAQEHETTAEH